MAISKKAIIGAVLLVVIVAVVVAMLTSHTGPPQSEEVLHAAYPLYAQGIVWNDEVPLSVPPRVATNPTDQTIIGNVVTSIPTATTTNVASVTEPFRDFYDKALIANGWSIAPKYQADGPGSSVWGYTKDQNILIFSYQSTFLDQKPDQPVRCPCTLQFSILGGTLQ